MANVTGVSDELLAALNSRAERQPAAFTLLVPATPSEGGRALARERLRLALERLRALGLEVEGRVAAGDPLVAVSEAWDPLRYDEVVVSTLPMRLSKWLGVGLPRRISELTGAPVSHVVCQPQPRIEVVRIAPRHSSGLGPLSVLTGGLSVLRWGQPGDPGGPAGRSVRAERRT